MLFGVKTRNSKPDGDPEKEFENPMKKESAERKDIVVYGGKDGVEIEALADSDTVWLNRQQMAKLFGRDVKTIGKHIANALKEELKGFPTVAKFATVQTEGGRSVVRQVEYYDLDMILSVGYRVKSPQGVLFRRWANGVLKAQLMRRATDNKLLKELEKRFADHELRLSDIEQAMRSVLDTVMPPLKDKRAPIGFHP